MWQWMYVQRKQKIDWKKSEIYVDIFMVRIGWFLPISSTKSLSLLFYFGGISEYMCGHWIQFMPLFTLNSSLSPYGCMRDEFQVSAVDLWWLRKLVWCHEQYEQKEKERKKLLFFSYKYEPSQKTNHIQRLVCSVCSTYLKQARWRNEC